MQKEQVASTHNDGTYDAKEVDGHDKDPNVSGASLSLWREEAPPFPSRGPLLGGSALELDLGIRLSSVARCGRRDMLESLRTPLGCMEGLPE